jgi:Sel1 repeat
MSSQHPMRSEPTDDEPHGNPGQAGRRARQFRGPMHRWVVMAALLLAMGAALPARADDAADCSWPPKTDRARPACQRLADQGHAWAQNNLGAMYGYDEHYPEAASWFRKAAEQGDATAQINLGVLYESGHGVPQSYVEAAMWYRKAADQGDVDAQYKLGSVYHEGVPQDDVEAVKWFRKAADQGNADAQDMLGDMYEHGWGTPRDYVRAHMWFNLAATQANNVDYILAGFAADSRDRVAAKMTPAQVGEAQALAVAWKPAARPGLPPLPPSAKLDSPAP